LMIILRQNIENYIPVAAAVKMPDESMAHFKKLRNRNERNGLQWQLLQKRKTF